VLASEAMRPLLIRALIPALLPCLVVVTACGGDDSDGGGDTAAATGSTSGATATPTDGVDDGGSTAATPTADTGMVDTGGSTAADGSTGDVDSTGSEETAADSTGFVEFTVTSPSFKEGGGIPGIHHISGGNVHPQLDWVGVPAEAMSIGVFFHDDSINNPHSGIWNIPADADGLPEDVDHGAMPANVPGAVQSRSWASGMPGYPAMFEYGYGGMGSPSNTYSFTVYALDVGDLSGEIDENTPRGMVRTVLMAHSIGEAVLTGQSTGP